MALLTGVANPLLYPQTSLKPLCFSWQSQAAADGVTARLHSACMSLASMPSGGRCRRG